MQTGSHSGGGMKVTVVNVGVVFDVGVSCGVVLVMYGVVVLPVVVLVVVVSHGTHRATGQQASASQTTRSYPSGHGQSPSSTHLLETHSQA